MLALPCSYNSFTPPLFLKKSRPTRPTTRTTATPIRTSTNNNNNNSNKSNSIQRMTSQNNNNMNNNDNNSDNNSDNKSSIPVLVHTSPFLPQTTDSEAPNRALVILNSPIRTPPSPLFTELWNTSAIRVCADGGANRLYKADTQLIPDLICGDLDSVVPFVRDYYHQQHNVTIERDACQNSNDLDKALTALLKTKEVYTRVIVYGAFGGRFDQEMGCIQALYKWSAKFQYRMVLMDDITTAFLMPPHVRNEIRLSFYGTNIPTTTAMTTTTTATTTITTANDNDNNSSNNDHDDHVDQNGSTATTTNNNNTNNSQHEKQQIIVLGEGPTCGIIPVGCKCDSVRTTGFKWDLDGSIPLEFGGLVSTSNHVSQQVATVEASHPLIFTAEVSCGIKDIF